MILQKSESSPPLVVTQPRAHFCTIPVERGEHECLEGVGEGVGGRVVGVLYRRPPELEVRVLEAIV